MSRVLAAVLTAVCAAVLAALAVAPADGRSRFSCAKARGTTVEQTREARVVRRVNRSLPDELFACLLSRRSHPVELGTTDIESEIDAVVLAGRFLALIRTDGSPVGGDVERSAVEVWDLRRDDRRFEHAEAQRTPDEIIPFATNVVLTRSGSVAWTTTDGRVLRSQGFAAPEVLEAGGAVPDSLALSRGAPGGLRRIYWALADGSVRMATLR